LNYNVLFVVDNFLSATHVPSHAEIPRKMILWRIQGNHVIKRNAPQINIEAIWKVYNTGQSQAA